MFMDMSIDTLNYAVKLRQRHDSLKEALKYILSGNHGMIRVMLPTGHKVHDIDVPMSSLTQQNLLQLEIDRVKKEIVNLTSSSDPPKKEIVK